MATEIGRDVLPGHKTHPGPEIPTFKPTAREPQEQVTQLLSN